MAFKCQVRYDTNFYYSDKQITIHFLVKENQLIYYFAAQVGLLVTNKKKFYIKNEENTL